MRNVVFVLAGIMAAVVVACSGAWAQDKGGLGPGKHGFGFFGKERINTMMDELGLNQDQKDKVHEVLKGHRGEFAPVFKKIGEARKSLRETMLSGTADEAAIRTAAQAVGQAIGDAAVMGGKVVGEVKPILTPEQLEKLQKIMDKHEGFMGQPGKDGPPPHCQRGKGPADKDQAPAGGEEKEHGQRHH